MMHLYRVFRLGEADADEAYELIVRASSSKRAMEIACMATVKTVTTLFRGRVVETKEHVVHDYPGFELAKVGAERLDVDGEEGVVFEPYVERCC